MKNSKFLPLALLTLTLAVTAGCSTAPIDTPPEPVVEEPEVVEPSEPEIIQINDMVIDEDCQDQCLDAYAETRFDPNFVLEGCYVSCQLEKE